MGEEEEGEEEDEEEGAGGGRGGGGGGLATRNGSAAHWGERKLGDAKPKARLYPPATHSLGFVHSL